MATIIFAGLSSPCCLKKKVTERELLPHVNVTETGLLPHNGFTKIEEAWTWLKAQQGNERGVADSCP